MGIRTKLSIEVGFLVFLSFFVAGIFLYVVGNKYMLQKNIFAARNSAAEYTFAARNAVLKKDSAHLNSILKELACDPSVFWAGFQDAGGVMRFHSNDLMVGGSVRDYAFQKAFESEEFVSREYKTKNKEVIEFIRPVYRGPDREGIVRAVFDLSILRKNADKDMMRLVRMYVFAGIITFVVGMIIANMRGFSIVRRIETIKKGADEISRGNIGYHMQEEGNDEIFFLSKTFNTMSDKLKEIDMLKDDFIARISHELKSPVSVIKGFIEKLGDDKTLNQKTRKYISQLSYGSDRLEHIVNQTLNISRMKAGKMDFHFEQINLGELIPEVVGFFKEKTSNKKIELTCSIEQGIKPVWADSEAVCEVLANLLSNAVKFTREGSIHVWAKANSGTDVLVGVQDTGIGIPPDRIDVLFDKFIRIPENKRKMPESKGTGLGLAIVKSIVESHKGTVLVESSVDKGSNIMFTLPVFAG